MVSQFLGLLQGKRGATGKDLNEKSRTGRTNSGKKSRREGSKGGQLCEVPAGREAKAAGYVPYKVCRPPINDRAAPSKLYSPYGGGGRKSSLSDGTMIQMVNLIKLISYNRRFPKLQNDNLDRWRACLREYNGSNLLIEPNVSAISKPSSVAEFPVRLFPPFVYYIFCGGIATIMDWGSFYIITYIIGWNYIIAVTLSFMCGSIINYSLNKIITFRNKYKSIHFQFCLYLIGACSSLLLTYVLMLLFVECFSFGKMHSRIIITAIMLFYNYSFHKVYTFGRLK